MGCHLWIQMCSMFYLINCSTIVSPKSTEKTCFPFSLILRINGAGNWSIYLQPSHVKLSLMMAPAGYWLSWCPFIQPVCLMFLNAHMHTFLGQVLRETHIINIEKGHLRVSHPPHKLHFKYRVNGFWNLHIKFSCCRLWFYKFLAPLNFLLFIFFTIFQNSVHMTPLYQ